MAPDTRTLLQKIRSSAVRAAHAEPVEWTGVAPDRPRLGHSERTSGFGSSGKMSCRGACYSGLPYLLRSSGAVPLAPVSID